MATITTTVLLDSGQSLAHSFTVQAADMTRIITWALQYYPAQLDSNGAPITPTPQTCANGMSAEFWNSIFSRVLSYNQQQASIVAAQQVSPIIATGL